MTIPELRTTKKNNEIYVHMDHYLEQKKLLEESETTIRALKSYIEGQKIDIEGLTEQVKAFDLSIKWRVGRWNNKEITAEDALDRIERDRIKSLVKT